jgi:hypothetical protein
MLKPKKMDILPKFDGKYSGRFGSLGATLSGDRYAFEDKFLFC